MYVNKVLLPFLLFLAVWLSACQSTRDISPELKKTVHHYVFFGRDREQIHHKLFLKTDELKGAQLTYAWRELESAEDVYEFGEIDQDLNFLQNQGKTLFIQLQDTTFSVHRKAVPNYLLKDPKYGGGAVYQYDNKGKPEGWVAMRWNPAVRKRFHRLLLALGKKYDGRIAGINLQETAIGVVEKGPTAPKGFSYRAYRNAIAENMRALGKAFSKSITMQYLNYMPGEWLPDEDRSYLRSLFKLGEQIGVGVGVPDLMPENKNYHHHAYHFIKQLKSPLPVGAAVQDGNYAGKTGTSVKPTEPWTDPVPRLAAFARSELKADYIFWGFEEPYFSKNVVPYFRTHN